MAGFAMMEALVVMANVLREFRISTVPGDRFPIADPRITLRPSSCFLLLDRQPKRQSQINAEAGLNGSAPNSQYATTANDLPRIS